MKIYCVFIISFSSMAHAMQMVCLRDGSIRPLIAVEKTMAKLQDLPVKYELLGVRALGELLQKALDSQHDCSLDVRKILLKNQLISVDGCLNGIVKSVVLSSINIDLRMLRIWIRNPIGVDR